MRYFFELQKHAVSHERRLWETAVWLQSILIHGATSPIINGHWKKIPRQSSEIFSVINFGNVHLKIWNWNFCLNVLIFSHTNQVPEGKSPFSLLLLYLGLGLCSCKFGNLFCNRSYFSWWHISQNQWIREKNLLIVQLRMASNKII